MNYCENAAVLSNTALVDITFINNLSKKFESNDQLNPIDIVDLARLIETFVLCDEVVVRDGHLIWDDTFHRNGAPYKFTNEWIDVFSENHVIKGDKNSAADFLANEFIRYHAEERQELYLYGMDKTQYYLSKTLEDSSRIWSILAKYCGIPFVTKDLNKEYEDSKKHTNISLDLYYRMEEYHQAYFAKMSKYLGPTAVRIPSLLSLVLSEVQTINDIPKIIMQIRDSYARFIMEVTELEYRLRVAPNEKERIEIIQMVDNCYNSIKSDKDKTKMRISTRIFDVAQKIFDENFAKSTLNYLRDLDIEKHSLILIPGYYDLWNAADEVEQAIPLLRKVFGKQIDERFLIKLSEINNMKK